jgi:hypothetical protein
MDGQQVLMGRVDSLLQELDDSRGVLDGLEVSANLLQRAGGSFEKLFKEERKALEELRSEIGAGDLRSLWIDLDGISQEARPLFREYLAFIEGLLVRRTAVDNGLCRIADILLDDVSRRTGIRWGKFTILADGEAYADLAEIIRLRFPDLSTWNVPIAAHEFGHFAAERLEDRHNGGPARRPFVELLETRTVEIKRPEEASYEAYLHEFFADVFATYVAGPAYAFVCLLLRFNPCDANVDGVTHPSAARRAAAILRTLELIDAEEARLNRLNHPYRSVVDELRVTWAESLQSTGQTAELPDGAVAELDDVVDRFWRLISAGVNPEGMYAAAAWRRAQSIADGLAEGRAAGTFLRGDETMTDIVNGAWIARLGLELQSRQAVAPLSYRVHELAEMTQDRRDD